MKNLESLLLLSCLGLVAVLTPGCASVACGHRQDVALYSKPNGAEVIVYDNHGEIVYRGETPCVAKLVRAEPESERANYVVLMRKDGWEPAQLQLKGTMNRAGLVSIFGGAGAFVDSGSGGMWTLVPTGEHPQLMQESPDMLRPDGLCLVLKEGTVGPIAAKTVAAKTVAAGQ